jgi:hypothetical protein
VAVNISPADQAATIVGISVKYKIPLNALLGIYGQETTFGTASNMTSSAGAMGPFQFIPSTAAKYNYPLTNNPTLSQFQQQADAWGRYLVANNPSRSSSGWAPAMGGGYTESQAESTLKSMPAALKSGLSRAILMAQANGQSIPGDVSTTPAAGPASVIAAAKDAIDSVPKFLSLITSQAFLIRLGEVIAGMILLAMGLRSLTGAAAG